jgi:hypothetical protein
MCGDYESVGDPVEVYADTWGWVPPQSPECGTPIGLPWRMRSWLAGLGAVVVARLVGHAWVRLTVRGRR